MADYARLASQLRGVQRMRAKRFERERPAKVADPNQVPLDDVLDFLHTEDAQAVLQTIDTELRAALDRSDPSSASPWAVGPHPQKLDDPFLEGVLDFYRENWDTDLDTQKLPQAITSSFAKWTGQDGYLNKVATADKVGATGGKVLHALLANGPIKRSSLDGSSKSTGKYTGLGLTTAGQVAQSKQRDGYLARMPVVTDLLKLLGNDVFDGFAMSSVQHLFPSAMGLYQALFSGGLDPEQTFVGGKYYSANVNTVTLMHATGMRVIGDAREVRDHVTDAEADVKQMARKQLYQMFKGVDPNQKGPPQFLLLDDGGKLIQALHDDPKLARYAHLCVAVEQTTRGVQVIEEMQESGKPLLCPVVNMALSELKKKFESPLIAESLAWHIDRTIESLDLPTHSQTPEGPRKREAVVVGFGNTGAAMAEALQRRGYHVIVTDKDPKKLEEAAQAGFTALSREEALPRAELLVGSTGRGALSKEDWSKLPDGALLVNGASGNHELGIGAMSYKELDAMDPDRTTETDGRITTTFGGQKLELGHSHDDMRLAHRTVSTGGGKKAFFMRGGSVLNMEHDLPPEYRQIIVGMLVASCAQAVKAGKEGKPATLEVIDPKMQAFLLSRYRKALRNARLPMDPPDFDAIKAPFG